MLSFLKKYKFIGFNGAFQRQNGNEFDLQTELEKTIQVIDDTIEKAEKKLKMKKLPYPVEKIDYYDLENYVVEENLLYILEVKKDNVKYEYLINRKTDNDNNSQLDVSNWAFISAVDYVMEYCFDNIGTALKYPERFNVV